MDIYDVQLNKTVDISLVFQRKQIISRLDIICSQDLYAFFMGNLSEQREYKKFRRLSIASVFDGKTELAFYFFFSTLFTNPLL